MSLNTFKRRGFTLVKAFVSSETCDLLKHYVINNIRLGLFDHDPTLSSEQIAGYSTPLGEAILSQTRDKVSRVVGEPVLPTFSFLRLYHAGEGLAKHTDRSACEICVSLFFGSIGRRPRNNWPLFCAGTPMTCRPGDAVIFRGCEVPHWRAKLAVETWGCLMLHYVCEHGPNRREMYDRRGAIGVTSEFLEREIQVPAVFRRQGVCSDQWPLWRRLCYVAAFDRATRNALVRAPKHTLQRYGITWRDGRKRLRLIPTSPGAVSITLPASALRRGATSVDLALESSTFYWKRWLVNTIASQSGLAVPQVWYLRPRLDEIVDAALSSTMIGNRWDRLPLIIAQAVREHCGLDRSPVPMKVYQQETSREVRVVLPSSTAMWTRLDRSEP